MPGAADSCQPLNFPLVFGEPGQSAETLMDYFCMSYLLCFLQEQYTKKQFKALLNSLQNLILEIIYLIKQHYKTRNQENPNKQIITYTFGKTKGFLPPSPFPLNRAEPAAATHSAAPSSAACARMPPRCANRKEVV